MREAAEAEARGEIARITAAIKEAEEAKSKAALKAEEVKQEAAARAAAEQQAKEEAARAAAAKAAAEQKAKEEAVVTFTNPRPELTLLPQSESEP